MRIAYILNSFLPDYIGGTETYTSTLATYMQKNGNEVCIIIPCLNKNDTKSYIYNEIKVYKYFEPTINSRNFIIGKFIPNGINNFLILVDKFKPDIVNFEMISSGIGITIYHLLALKQKGYICGLTIHLSHYSCLTGNLLKYNIHKCDGKITQIKCTTCYLKNKKHTIVIAFAFTMALIIINKLFKLKNEMFNDLINYSKNRKLNLIKLEEQLDFIISITFWYKDILILNKIPLNKIYVVKQGLIPMNETFNNIQFNFNPLRLLFIGRIDPIKGLHIILKSLIGIRKSNYQFNIYGNINDNLIYYKYCINLIQKYDLSVTFNGILNRENIYNELINHDFLCLPSLFSEMSPLVIQEAFSAKLPIIGSNVPGIIEEVKHMKNGIIFPFGDSSFLKKMIKLLIKNPKIHENLAKNIKAPRSFDLVGKETLNIYKKLILQFP